MRQGKSIASSLPHLVFMPESLRGNLPTIIAIHGRGADERDLAPIVEALGLSDVLLVTPRAPFAFPYGGYLWYGVAEEAIPDPETFGTSLKLLQKFVQEVRDGYPVNPEQLILLGFSQGTVMAYATALLQPSAFLAVVALSGYIPSQSGLPLQLNQLEGFPVFISHGTNDPMIPARLGREASEILIRANADVTYREYPMGHEVTEEVIRDLKQWIRKQIPDA